MKFQMSQPISITGIRLFGLIFFMIIFISSNISISQGLDNLTPQNISQVDVDRLSDDQLRQYLKAMQDRGLSQSQVEVALRQRGMSEAQIQKLRARIQGLGTSSGRTGEFGTEGRDRQTTPDVDQAISILQVNKPKTDTLRTKIFGASLFGNPALTFEPSMNIATPGNYRIGPGDEIIIDIWGASEANFTSTVSPEGSILIRNLGPIHVNGLAIDEASAKLTARLSSIFSGLKGANPNTFVQISLGNVRSVKISVIGEAVQPGTYTVSSLSTVFNVLNAAGGPTSNGTFRDIQVVRNNKVIARLDLYQFLMTGEQQNNIRLEDQDIVRIGPFLQRVVLTGEKKRKENIYELREGETAADLIQYAGGFSDKAYSSHLIVKRNTEKERRIIDVPSSEFGAFKLQAGDMMNIAPILERFENRVQITGAVFREGEYQLSEGLTAKRLIEKAEGLRGDAFLERGTIYRTKDDYSTEVIPFNIRELLKEGSADIFLQREDLVKISSIYDLNEEYFVEVKGEISRPGVFPYMSNMTVEDLIVLGGGFLESASNSHIEIVRRFKTNPTAESAQVAEIFTFNISPNLRMEKKDLEFTLRPFDMLFVRKSPGYQVQQTVQIAGEAQYPGFYGIQTKNERISDLVKRAGGLTADAYVSGATLIRQTEYFEQRNDRDAQIAKINDLKRRNGSLTASGQVLTEAEYHRRQRLSQISNIEHTGALEDIFETKRETLRELEKRDSLTLGTSVKESEAIGIDLDAILKNPGGKHDLILKDGDILNIPKELQTVRLRGELIYPVTVRYDKRNSFMNYVSQAGGFSENAKKKKAYVVYANGSVDRTRNFLGFRNFPEVDPGSEIIVPSKPERRPLSAQETIGITSGIATLGLLILNLVNNL